MAHDVTVSQRQVTVVDMDQGEVPRTVHYSGVPPMGEKDAPDHRVALPVARVLLVEATDEGVFLERYAESGEFAGDTWHKSIPEAVAQAEFEYGAGVGPWSAVPPAVEDVLAFALDRGNER